MTDADHFGQDKHTSVASLRTDRHQIGITDRHRRNRHGNPTTDANAFYGPPQGALLPIAEHKGFGLGLVGDILAGALSGAGCTRPGDNRIGNSFLMILVDVERVRGAGAFGQDVDNLVDYVKSSRLAPGVSEILTPGEPEERTQARREKEGIPIHEATWEDIVGTAEKYGVTDVPPLG